MLQSAMSSLWMASMLLPNELLRCEDEQIHIPGLIQPLGYLFVVQKEESFINYAGQNSHELLNLRKSSDILGKSLLEIAPELTLLVDDFLKTLTLKNRKIYFDISVEKFEHKLFDVFLSSINADEIIIELLRKTKNQEDKNNLLKEANNFLLKAIKSPDLASLYSLISSHVREITGYDRVMIYKFDAAFNGEVVSEEKGENQISYLHLHYPASDIPAQARELYLKNNIRIINDVNYEAYPIISHSPSKLDMSLSFLRSVSPIHLEYMKNMGVYASMTISIIVEGRLWGMIACHHNSSFHPSVEVIESCEQLAVPAASMIELFEETIYQTNKSQFLAKVDTTLFMLRQNFDSKNLSKFVGENILYFMPIFDSEGIIFISDEKIYSRGIHLEEAQIQLLVENIRNIDFKSAQCVYCTTSLNEISNNLQLEILKECAGVLVVKINENKMFVWTKKEQIYNIDWSGDPLKRADQMLSPRKSFEKFSQTVVLKSLPWENNTSENMELLVKKIKDFLYIHESGSTIESQNTIISIMEEEKSKNYEQLIDMLVTMIEKRDAYTAGHTNRVSRLCTLIATEMKLGANDIDLLRQASKLHDIGKVVIPDAILLKPSKLTASEYKLIQSHLTTGYEILSKIESYKEIANIVRYHHERYDGTGYPQHVKESEIPLLSQIMIVADAFDAMTSNRIYQKTKGTKVAMQEILSLREKWYHPDVVDALLRIYTKNEILIEDSSQIPLTEMENERFAYFFKDQMTGYFNESYLWLILANKLEVINPKYILLIELHNMSEYNKAYGWNKGNLLIIEVANKVAALENNLAVCRLFGDDFAICFDDEKSYLKAMQTWADIKVENVYTTLRAINKESWMDNMNVL